MIEEAVDCPSASTPRVASCILSEQKKREDSAGSQGSQSSSLTKQLAADLASDE